LAKAKKVKGLRCADPVIVNARAIIEVRLNEVLSYADCVENAENIDEIHNLRIAAKRLRYTLEMFEFAFPKGLNAFIKEVKEVQTSIGNMRDADVMIDRVNEILERNRSERAVHLLDIATAVDRGTVAQRRHRIKSAITTRSAPRDEIAYYTLIAHRTDDSVGSYNQFLEAWDRFQSTDFPGRLRLFVGIDQPETLPADEGSVAEVVPEIESEAELMGDVLAAETVVGIDERAHLGEPGDDV
jgi:hypothetical protein